MFYTLIIFIISGIIEALLFIFLSPLDNEGRINYLNAILFSLNTGLLIGSLYALFLFFVYWLMKAYDEIILKNFYRRAIFVGSLVAIILFLKLINALDYLIIVGLVVVVICLEIILSRKE